MSKINELDFKSMVAAGDVAKYLIIDNRKKVKVYLTKTGLTKYADKLKKGVSGKIAEEGPHMIFTITSGDTFKKGIDDFYKENPTVAKVPFDVDNERDIFGGILQFLFSAGAWARPK